MKTVTVQAGATIDLGYQYDNYATEVIFPAEIIEPITDAFGSTGTFAIWYRRSGDSLGYPIGSPLVTFDSANDEVTWDIVESDTASPGVSQVQLRYIVDEVCVMSQIFAGNVADSVDTGTEVPEPMEQWADAIVSAGAGGQPTVATSVSAMSDHNTIYLYTGSESGYIYGHIYYWNGSAWTDGGAYGGVSSSGTGLTDDIKQALLDCFEHVAWTDEHGQDYVDALEAALYPPAELASISAVYTQSGTVYTTDSLDDLKSDLVVTAIYTDNTTETVTTYTLSGTLTEGTSVITVSYGGKTTTFNVTVTAPATLSSITAVYTQSGTVYDTDSLDSLKSDLVVTAVYSDSTTETVASTDYTLSGTLTEGTSTITVSYGGKTTTFTVTVTHSAVPSGYLGLDYLTVTGAEYISTGLAETDYFSAEYKIRQTTTKTSPHIFSSQNTYYPMFQNVSGGSHRINSKAKGTETALTFAWETGVDYVIEVDATTGNVSVNDESVGTITIGATASASNKYALFAYGGNTGNTNYRFEGLFYYMKLMSSGTVVHEFIPVQRISDSVKGVYDTVTSTFFESSGTAFS